MVFTNAGGVMERRVRRRWLGLVAGGVALAALAAALPGLLGAALTQALRHVGLKDAAVEITALGVSESRAVLRAGGIDAHIAVQHPLGRLLHGRAERITVSGATVHLPLSGFGGEGGDGSSGGLPTLPADELVVEDSRLVLEAPDGPLAVEIAAVLRTADGTLDLRSQGASLHAAGQAAADGALLLEVTGNSLDLALAAALAGSEIPIAGLAGLTGTLHARLTGDGVVLTPDGCLTLTAKGLAVRGETVALPKGLCLRGVGDTLVLAGGGVRAQALTIAGTLGLPARRLTVDDFALAVSYDGGLAAELTQGRLRSTDAPPVFAPLALTGRAEGAFGGPLAFTAAATGPTGVTLEAKGTHEPATGAGQAELRLRPITFREGGSNPAVLAPRHAGGITAAAGKLAGRGQLAWNDGGLTSKGELMLTDVAGTLGPVSVAGLNGVLRLSSLMPPVLPSGQSLAVKVLDVGLPLTDGVVTVGLSHRGILDVDRAEWRWAGGVVRAKPFEIALDAPKGVIELAAEGLDLGTVLALASIDGLNAEGRLSGTLPVRVDDGAVRLDGGVLEAEAPGRLSYDPEQPPAALKGDPGSPTGLLLGALTDFRYESLRATVDGEAGGEMRVGLRVLGANPEFYGGHPVALNLNLSGALDRILRQGLDAYRIPDAVRERMLDFEKKGPS